MEPSVNDPQPDSPLPSNNILSDSCTRRICSFFRGHLPVITFWVKLAIFFASAAISIALAGIVVALVAIAVAFFLGNGDPLRARTLQLSSQPLYSPLALPVSPPPFSEEMTRQERILETTLKRTAESLEKSRHALLGIIECKDTGSEQRLVSKACMEMMNARTLRKIRATAGDFHAAFQHQRSFLIVGNICRLYSNLEFLLRVSLTEHDTCLRHFSSALRNDNEPRRGQMRIWDFIRDQHIPATSTVTTSLATVRELEKTCWRKATSRERKMRKESQNRGAAEVLQN